MKAVVIGGSGGIGYEIAKRLSHEVSFLGIHAGSQSKKLDALINYTKKNTEVETLIQRFSLEKGTATFDSLLQSGFNDFLKDADILCISYGPFLQKPLHHMSQDEWLEMSFFNYTFPGILISQVLPSMMEKKFGRILVFGGTRTEQIRSFKTNAAYGGAKTALCTLVQSISALYADKNILCNAILPGFINTEYLDERQKNECKHLGGRVLEVKDIADAAMFLLNSPHISENCCELMEDLAFKAKNMTK